MGIMDKVRACNGIVKLLEKYETGINIHEERPLNNLFLAFAKEIGKEEEFAKNNSRYYKGSFQPSLSNALIIQEHYGEFKKWVKTNYELKVKN